TGANFAGALIQNANFSRDPYLGGTGISVPQLLSTASYQLGDLTGVKLGYIDLTGINLKNQNLTNASFSYAKIDNVDFTGAVVQYANFAAAKITLAQLYSTASYQRGDLPGIILDAADLTAANFRNQKLNGASFESCNLAGADFSGANLT